MLNSFHGGRESVPNSGPGAVIIYIGVVVLMLRLDISLAFGRFFLFLLVYLSVCNTSDRTILNAEGYTHGA